VDYESLAADAASLSLAVYNNAMDVDIFLILAYKIAENGWCPTSRYPYLPIFMLCSGSSFN